MNRLFYILLFSCVLSLGVYTPFAQTLPATTRLMDLDIAVGDAEVSLALSYNFDWGLGKNKKMVVGWGGRFTSYFGKNQFRILCPVFVE
jgi:hypothetical protein